MMASGAKGVTVMTIEVVNQNRHHQSHGQAPENGVNSSDERLDSTENLSDIISELRDIESETTAQNEDKSQDDQSDDELNRTPDEGEQELSWVKDAGLENIASRFEEGKEITDEIIQKETTTLTRKQADAVKKRVNTLNNTLRKKQKRQDKADVRAMFNDGSNTQEPVIIRRTDTSSGDRRRNGMLSLAPAGGDGTESMGSNSTSGGGGGGATTTNHHYHQQQRKEVGKKVATIVRLPSRGEYSLHGQHDHQPGVETISIQQKEIVTPSSPPRGDYTTMYRPRTLVDDDLTVSFKADDSIVPDDSAAASKNNQSSPTKSKKGGLPNFILEQEILGVTKVADLSRKDLQKVRSLALIELTALYDVHEITYSRRKGKKRYRDSGVFGVPLQTLYDHDCKKRPHLKVPLFFQQLVNHIIKCGIEEEGILRVPGSTTRIKQLRSEIDDKFNSGKFCWDDVQINDAASMLKQLIRELPVPLLTFDYFEAFAEIESITDTTYKQKLQALNLLVLMLPEVHRNTLQMLLKLLNSIVDEEENKMTINNVAMIMAPNLFLLPSSHRKGMVSTIPDITYAARKSDIVRMLIKYQDMCWTIPSFIVAQVRSQYETTQVRKSRDKSVYWVNFMKFLGRKEKTEPVLKRPSIQNEGDFNERVIRVFALHLSKESTAVQLDGVTTAYDIVARFHTNTTSPATTTTNSQTHVEQKNQHNGMTEQTSGRDPFFLTTHLYEHGGNIGERRLNHSCKMLALYKINPNAQWAIRTSSPD